MDSGFLCRICKLIQKKKTLYDTHGELTLLGVYVLQCGMRIDPPPFVFVHINVL